MKSKHQQLLRWPSKLMRATTLAILVAFGGGIVSPTIVLARGAAQRAKVAATPKRTELADLSESLIKLEEVLDRMNRRLQGRWEYEWQAIANRGGQTPPAAVDRTALRALEDELDASVPRLESLQGAVRAYFAETRQHIERSNLAPEILVRHDGSRAEYERSYSELQSLLHAIKTAHTVEEFKTAVAAADAFMKQHSSKRKRAAFDPNATLAFGPVKKKAIKARTDAKAIRNALGIAEPDAKSLARDANRKAAPTAAELAETEDAQLTAAIRAKAEELGRNPVAIYNFVRNNVEFLPTYGSIQGADQTLKTLRGNAFDQSSLLIALLRAAEIPARYVYGTIELPIGQVQNWVGGTETPQAAMEMLGAGGIPNVGLVQGGVVKMVRLEHVWVEAFVDFVPSRGAKNVAGDTWVPLDASFKQYLIDDGMNILVDLPLDTTALATRLNSTTTVNSGEGWAQNLDQEYVKQELVAYNDRLADFVAEQSSDASMDDILGEKLIVSGDTKLLSGNLPHAKTSIANRSAALPSSLQWKFRFSLDGTMMLERALASLSGKQMAVSFRPSSAADEAAIRSLIPAGADDVDDLPTSIPASLARLSAEFTIDGSVVATSTANQIGTELTTRKGLFAPGQGWQETDNPLTVGDYQAIGVDAAGLSMDELERHRARILQTKTQLDASNVSGLTRHDLTGAFLQTGVLSYFTQTYVQSQIAAKLGKVLSYPLPSYGTVATASEVQYLFGVPRSFTPKGVIMDMDRMASATVAKSGDVRTWRAFNETVGGLMSAHESTVMEQLFEDRNEATAKVEGISAAKAISIASSQGQRIYTITRETLDAALNAISLSPEVEAEIADAVGSGKVVTTHQSHLNYEGIHAAGYVIIDAETGAGAYKIESGADGAAIFIDVIGWILVVLLFVCLVPEIAVALGITAFWYTFLSIVSIVVSVIDMMNELECGGLTGGLVGIAVAALLALVLRASAQIQSLVSAINGFIAGEAAPPALNPILCQ